MKNTASTHNKTRFEDVSLHLKQQDAQLSLINSMQEAIGNGSGMQEIYDLVGDCIRDLFDAQVTAICTFDNEKNIEIFHYVFEDGRNHQIDPRPIDKLRQRLIDKGELILINENADEMWIQLTGEAPTMVPGTLMTKSALYVPMVVGKIVRGYLSLQNVDRENAFSEADVRLLSTLTNSMSVALESVRLFNETEQRNAELLVINSVQEGLVAEMNGLTLLTKLAEQNSRLKCVIVSAYGDMENIRTAINRGAFDFITKPVDFKDLEITTEKTISHVAGIKKTLQAVKENNILRMYVDETVLDFMGGKKIESSLFDNETVDGTGASIDICGFTVITENEPVDKVVAMLNAYFDIMVNEIKKEEGTVDKFLGDAVMASFKGEFHLDRAMDACLSIRKAIHNSDITIGSNTYKLEVSIGINSGEMLLGNIGSAKLRRLDYTNIGDAVNVAARLQGAAKKSQILVSEANYEKVKESFSRNRVAEIKMKNRENPLTVYEILN